MPVSVKNVAFILLPEFALLSFCSASEPLRVANRLSKANHYQWKLYSIDGKAVTSSNTMASQVDGSLDQLRQADLVVVVASFNPQTSISSSLLKKLKSLALQGAFIAGIDTGPYILARAGLLDGYQATMHWEDLNNFRQTFPRVKVNSNRYVIDNKRLTAAGAAASMDMILELISQQHGQLLAAKIAEQFVYTPSFNLSEPQRLPLAQRLDSNNPVLLKAISLMENHLEDTLTTGQIAHLCDISLRQLERLFRKHLNSTPGKWYRKIKLKNARIQLKQSYYSIAEIAANNGFESAASFSRAYKNQYHCAPSKDRATNSHT